MNNFFESFDKFSGIRNEWISVPSELESLDGSKNNIRIELMENGMPRAMAFFDIDGTLAHLSVIHGRTICKLFPNQNEQELEETYYKGFKLGNSFREFDRMWGIYVDGHLEWKDPEFYYKNRFIPNAKEIDEPGNKYHDIAARMLKEYGEIASKICDELYKENPKEFKKSNIEPIFLLARMFSRLGIPMVGFTANAKVFVEKLAKYLNLSEIFLDIATDETMTGGGKEIAIYKLIEKLESKNIKISRNQLIFVGDSLRGDIGSSLIANKKNHELKGQGVLVLKDKKALLEIKKQISENLELKKIVDSMNVYGFLVENVPLDEKGNPTLLFRFKEKFFEKL